MELGKKAEQDRHDVPVLRYFPLLALFPRHFIPFPLISSLAD
jgi:hypothetical protein